MKSKRVRGFTLIEILVVIGIIAILAAIVIIAINPARQFAQARDTERTSDVSAISNAIGQYIADHKGIASTTISVTPIDAIKICSDLIPTYMAALPVDPSKNQAAVTDCNASSYATDYTGYKVATTTGNRIIVSAVGEIPPSNPIQITR